MNTKPTLTLLTALLLAPLYAAEPPVLLENDLVSLEIEPVVGRFTRILDKPGRIDLAPAPALAGNFRLELIMPDKKTVTILGRDQKLREVRRSSGSVALHWSGPLKDGAGAEHAIGVHVDVKAAGNALEFGLHLENRTDHKIRTVS